MTSLQDLTNKKRTFFDTEPTVRVADPITMPVARRTMPPPFPARSRSARTAAAAVPPPAAQIVPVAPVMRAVPATQSALDGEAPTQMFERTDTAPKRWSLPLLAGVAAGLVGIVVPILCLLSVRDSDRANSLAPVPAAASSTVLVALPISSAPSGASVTLIGDGTVTVVGQTPLTVALDPSHAYDIVVALRDHETTMMHLEPHQTKGVAVALTTLH